MLLPSNLKLANSNFSPKMVHFLSLDFFCVLLGTKYGFVGSENHWIQFLTTFYTILQLFPSCSGKKMLIHK